MTSWLSSSLFSSAVILHWQRLPAALKSLIRKGGNLTGNISKLKSSFKMRIVLFHVHQVHLRRWSKASALSVPTPFLDCPLLKSFCRETYRKVWSLMIKNLKAYLSNEFKSFQVKRRVSSLRRKKERKPFLNRLKQFFQELNTKLKNMFDFYILIIHICVHFCALVLHHVLMQCSTVFLTLWVKGF